MKLRLPKQLKLALLACVITTSFATTIASGATLAENQQSQLGNVMYVGDSITHGYNEASYRWALFKILADNGIAQTEKGVKTGNYGNSGGVNTGAGYGGRAFANIHSAQSSARTYEVAGRQFGGRFDNSNITNWLGQSTTKTDGNSYPVGAANGATGATFTGDNAPDTYFIMLGTNDLLSDSGNNIQNDVGAKQTRLIGTSTDGGTTWSGTGDMDTIIRSMRLNNSTAEITITSIPCWAAGHSINLESQHVAVAGYNANLEKWAKAKGVRYIDVNKGLMDVASSLSFCGLTNLFLDDKLHPNAQGNLIIAGNIAKGSGYAGRTAGQYRKASTDFVMKAGTGGNITFSKIVLGTPTTEAVNETIAWTGAAGDLSKGYTLDFQVKVGNGGTALQPVTWNTGNSFAVTLGYGMISGTLNINEAYIQWGTTILYSMDMSINAESLRISYITGNASLGLNGGFYVWLGDMLIGEALSSSGSSNDGVTLTYGGAEGITLDSLSMTGGSWAPNTSLFVNPESSERFISNPVASSDNGAIDWKVTGFTHENNTLNLVVNIRSAINSSASGAGTVLGGTVTQGGNIGNLYANQGAWTGDIWVTLNMAGKATSWYAGQNNNTLTGNIYVRFIGTGVYGANDQKSGSCFFGAVNNNARVDGDVYVEFSAANLVLGSFTGPGFSVMGSYDATLNGNFTVVVNEGNLTRGILGGSQQGNQNCGGGTYIFVNGGRIGISPSDASIVGGGRAGGTIALGSHIEVSGGTVSGNIYGGGIAGTVNEGSQISIFGGRIEGSIYGGGTGGVVNGGTAITLDGTHSDILKILGNIYGGSNGAGAVNGGTTITLQNFVKGNALSKIGTATSIISGGGAGAGAVAGTKTLTLDNVHGDLLSIVKDFDDLNVKGHSDVILRNVQNTGSVNVEAGSILRLGALTLSALNLADGANLELLDGKLTTSSILLSGAHTIDASCRAGSALLVSTGAIQVNGVVTLNVNLEGATKDSIFTLVQGSSLAMGALGQINIVITNNNNEFARMVEWRLLAQGDTGYDANALKYIVTSEGAATLNWQGGAGTWKRANNSQLWETTATNKWYFDDDHVIFGEVGGGGNITLEGELMPASITVTGGEYTFIGDGSVSGAGSLTVAGGSLSLGGTTQYSHTGGTFLNGGTLVMNGGTFTAAPTITFGGGTLGFATDMNVSTWTFAGSSPRQLNVQKNVTVTAGSLGDCNITLSGEGVFSMRNEARTATSTITVDTGATLHITGSVASTELAQGNLFAGSGNIEFDLTSEQVKDFNAGNTFHGSWILTSGVVRLNGNGVGTYAEKKADAIVMNGAILRAEGTFAQNVGFTLRKHSEIDATGALTIEGDVTGAYNLKKTGTGNLILNGLVDVSSIEFGAGTLSSSRVGGWAYAGVLNITGNLTLGMAGGTAMTFSGTSNLGNNRTLTVNSEVAFTGAVSSSGTLTIKGSGKTIFGGYVGETSFSIVWIQTRHVEIARDMSIGDLRINQINGTVPSGLSIARGATLTVSTAITVGYEGIMTESYLDVYGTLKVADGVQNMVLGEWNGAQSVTHIYEGGTLEALGATLVLGNGKQQNGREPINSLIVEGMLKLKAFNFGSNEATGTSTLTLSDGGEIRIGSGGLVNSHPASGRVAVINLNGGILGTMSSGDGGGEGWSSSLAMNLLSNTIGTSFDVGSNQGMTLSGALTGVGKLNKTGAGSLTLTGGNTFSGGINLVEGSLTANTGGSFGKTSLMSMGSGTSALIRITNDLSLVATDAKELSVVSDQQRGLSLSGIFVRNGESGGTITLGASVDLSIGDKGRVAHIEAHELSLAHGTTLYFDLSDSATSSLPIVGSDYISLTGSLTLTGSGTNTIAVNPLTHLSAGSYLLIQTGGQMTLADWTLSGLSSGGTRQTFSLNNKTTTEGDATGNLYLQVAGDAAILTWAGGAGATWDRASGAKEDDADWTGNEASAILGTKFRDNDQVLFSGAGAGTVTLVGDLNPSNILVNNESGSDYTFVATSTESGKIVGETATLVKEGAGTLTLNLANTFGGGTILKGGTLAIGDVHALGVAGFLGSAGYIDMQGGTLQFNIADVVLSGKVSGSVAMLATNSGSFSGALSLEENGVLTLTDISVLGSNGTLNFNGGTVHIAENMTLPVSTKFTGSVLKLDIANGKTATAGANFETQDIFLSGQGVFSVDLDVKRTSAFTISEGSTLLLNYAGTSEVEFKGKMAGSGKIELCSAGSTLNSWIKVVTTDHTFTGTWQVNANAILLVNDGDCLGGYRFLDKAKADAIILNGGALRSNSTAIKMTLNQKMGVTLNADSYLSAINGGNILLENAWIVDSGERTLTFNALGTVLLGESASFGSALSLAWSNTGIFRLADGTGDKTLTNAVSMASNVTLGGGANVGKMIFSGAVSLGSARTLTVRSAVAFTGSTSWSDGFIVAGAGHLTLSGQIEAGSGLLVKGGLSNTLEVLGSFSVTSDIRLNANLILGGSQMVPVTVSANALILAANEAVASSFTLNQFATLNLTGTTEASDGSSTLTLAHWTETSTLTVDGGVLNVLSANAVAKDGTGHFIVKSGIANLKGFNLANGTKSHKIELQGGVLNIGVGGIACNANTTISFSGGTLGSLVEAWTSAKNIALGNTDSGIQNVTINTTQYNAMTQAYTENASTITLSGVLSNFNASNYSNLIKEGLGTLILSANNTATGSLTVKSGTVQLGATTATANGQWLGAIALETDANLNLSRTVDTTFSQGITGTGNLTISGGSATTRVVFASETGLANLNLTTGTVVLDTNLFNVTSITMSGGTTITSSGPDDRSLGSNVIANNKGTNTFGVPGTGALTFGTLQASAGSNGISTIAAKSDVTFSSTSLGGWGFTTSVDEGKTLTLNALISANASGTITKSGLGILVLTDYATGVGSQKAIAIDGGTLRFDLVAQKTTTYGQIISGSGTLQKAGEGTLILSGANTGTGNLDITGGKVQLGSGSTAGTWAGAMAIASGAELIINRSDNLALGTVISGAGSLTKNAAGNLSLSAGNSYTGGTTINQGTVTAGHVNALGTGAISLAGTAIDARAVFDASSFAVANAITLATGRYGTVSGSGYAGTITTAGNLTLGSILGTGASIVLNGGSLSMGAYAITNTITMGSDAIAEISGTGYTGEIYAEGVLTITDALTLSARVNVASGKTLSLTSTSYTGALSVEGTLHVGSALAVSELSVGNITTGASSVLNFNLASTSSYDKLVSSEALSLHTGTSFNLIAESGVLVHGASFTLMTGASLPDWANGTSSFNVTLSGATSSDWKYRWIYAEGQLTLTLKSKTEASNLVWNGGVSGAWNSDGAGWLEDEFFAETYKNTDAVTFTGTHAGLVTIDSITGVAPGSITITGGAYTFAGGAMSSGTLSITGGSLILKNVNTSSGSMTIAQGASVTLQGLGAWVGNMISNGTLVFDHTGAWSCGSALSGTGTIEKVGAEKLSLTGSVTVANFLVKDGTLALGEGGSISSKITIGTGADFASGAFAGTGRLELVGATQFSGLSGNQIVMNGGTLSLSLGASQSLTLSDSSLDKVTSGGKGAFELASGQLVVGANASGNLSGLAIVIKDGAQFSKADATGAWANDFYIEGIGNWSTVTLDNNAARIVLGEGVTLAGTVHLTGDATIAATGSGSSSMTNLDGGSHLLNKIAGGNLTISSLTGSLSTLNIQGGSFTLQSIATGKSISAVSLSANTSMIADNATEMALSNITGDGALVKNGIGLLILSGTNTYTGATTINGGTVRLAASTSLGTTAISMKGATLDLGSNALGHSMTIVSGENNVLQNASAYTGALAVNGGKLTLQSLLGSGASIALSGASLDAGSLALTNTITSSGTSELSASGFVGQLNITSGTLSFGTQLGGTALITMSGGSLDMGGFSSSRGMTVTGTGTLSNASNFTGGLTIDTAGTFTLNSELGTGTAIQFTAGSFDMNGKELTGRDLKISGEGTHTLTNHSNYKGNMTLGGSLTAASLSLGSGQILSLDGTQTLTGNLVLNGGTIKLDFNNTQGETLSLSGSGALSISSESILDINLSGTPLVYGNELVLIRTQSSSEGLSKLSVKINAGRMDGTLSVKENNLIYTVNTVKLLYWSVTDGEWTQSKGTVGSLGYDEHNLTWIVNRDTQDDNHFYAQDAAVFDGAGGVVSITNTITAGSILVDGDEDYSFVNGNLGKLSGTGGLTKNGTGTLSITGTNDYTGKTILTDGIIHVMSVGALGTGSLEFSGGTLQVGVNDTLGSIGGTGNVKLRIDVGKILEAGTQLNDRTVELFANSIENTGMLALTAAVTGAQFNLTNAVIDLKNTETSSAITTLGGMSILGSAARYCGVATVNRETVLVVSGSFSPAELHLLANSQDDEGRAQLNFDAYGADVSLSTALSGQGVILFADQVGGSGGGTLNITVTNAGEFGGTLVAQDGNIKFNQAGASVNKAVRLHAFSNRTITYVGNTLDGENSVRSYVSLLGEGTFVNAGAGSLVLLSTGQFTGDINLSDQNSSTNFASNWSFVTDQSVTSAGSMSINVTSAKAMSFGAGSSLVQSGNLLLNGAAHTLSFEAGSTWTTTSDAFVTLMSGSKIDFNFSSDQTVQAYISSDNDSIINVKMVTGRTLTLTHANMTNMYGTLTIERGIVKLSGAASLATTNDLAIKLTGGTLDISNNVGVANAYALSVTGSGSVLTGNNLAVGYTGTVEISGGLTLGAAMHSSAKLNLNAGASLDMASHAVASTLTVAGAASLIGNDQFVGNVVLTDASQLTVNNLQMNEGQSLTVGTSATISGNLSLNGGILNFDLDVNGPSVDVLTVTGNLIGIGSSETILKVANLASFTSAGTYTLMHIGGNIMNIPTGKLILDGQTGRSHANLSSVQSDLGWQIVLNVQDKSDSLDWTGGNGTWTQSVGDAHSGLGWHDAGSAWSVDGLGSDNKFYAGDGVEFKGSGATVTISGTVSPSSMLLSAGNFIMENAAGSGGITGSGALSITGGSLTMNGANATWSGQSSLEGGLLTLGNAGALGTGKLTYNAGCFGIAAGLEYSLSTANFALTAGVNSVDLAVQGILHAGSATLGNTVALVVTGSGILNLTLTEDRTGAISSEGTLNLINNTGEVSIGRLTADAIHLSGTGVTRSSQTDLNASVEASTLCLTSANSAGSIILKDGAILQFGAASSFSTKVTLTGTTNTLSSTAEATLSADIIGTGDLNVSGAHSLVLSGSFGLNTLNVLADTSLTLGAMNQSLTAAVVTGSLHIKGALSLGTGGISGTGSVEMGAATLTATGALTIDNDTSLVTSSVLNGGTHHVEISGALTGAGSLTKNGSGTLTLSNAATDANINLAEGSLDMNHSAATLRLAVDAGKSVMLENADLLKTASTVDIKGTLTTTGNVAGKVTLKAGGQLNLAGEMTNVIYVEGASTLNQTTGSWTSLNLASSSVLTYQSQSVGGGIDLVAGKTISAAQGATINGGLSLDGGTFAFNMANVNRDRAMVNLTGELTVKSATTIDLKSLVLGQAGKYSFTLFSGVSDFALDGSLLTLTGMDHLAINSYDWSKKDNSLVLNIFLSNQLVWTGETNANWSYNEADVNWTIGGDQSEFHELDYVTFDNTATNRDITLVTDVKIGGLKAASMSVLGDEDYSFAGVGNLTVTGKLLKQGGGSLTFANDGVNSFLKGIELTSGSGTTVLAGKSSFVGDLTIDAGLEIRSSALSQLSEVAGAGDILIDGTGGAELSGIAGAYTGRVTMQQGVLKNQNVLGDQRLDVLASGNVELSGISNAHLKSLKTTQAGVTISGLSGSITTADNSFVLSLSTSNQEVIHFGATGGSLDMGTLNLVFDDIVLLDPTGQHTFKITDGVFGSELMKHDNFGKYTHFSVTGAMGDNDAYFVLDIQGGSVTIGGMKAYENFVLDVNNKWTPHITDKQAAKFTAAEFRANANDQFKSVTVDGVLQLFGTEAFTLNALSGAFTGWIGVKDGAVVTINGADSIYQGTFVAGASHVVFTGNQSMMGRTEFGTLNVVSDAHLTIGALTSLAGNLVLDSKAHLTINSGAQVRVGGDVILDEKAKLDGSGTLTITQGGNLSLAQGATIDNRLIINLLSTGGAGDAATLDIGTSEISIGGITGTGTIVSETTGVINLHVDADVGLVFKGSLSGTGGTINKTGEGEQTLAASTDQGAVYALNVKEGTLIVEAAKGQSTADYGAITVGNQNSVQPRVRAVTAPLDSSKPIFVVNTNVTATKLVVQGDGLLVIGSDLNTSSLTLTGTAEFKTGSSLEMYIGNGGDKALIKASGDVTGLDSIGTLTLHAAISWQAYVKTVLFASDKEIMGNIGLDKIVMDGFGNQTITKTDDEKSIVFEASRSMDNNPFRDQVTGQNALAGLDLIWAANVEAGAKRQSLDAWSELGSVFNSLTMTGVDSPEAHRLLAGVAGATVTALAGSQRDDFRQQQTWIRNRTVGMGINPDFVHEDLPYVNGWIQANTGTKRVDSNGDEAGYNLDTFGGTVGFDVDMSAKITWGFAFTANYNKLTASGAESAKGRNDAYYANLFLRAQSKRWGHTVILTGGWNDAKLDRTVSGVGVNYTANGTTKGSTLGAMYEATYDYVLNENKTSILQPLFNLSFANASMDAYKEEGAGNAGLDVGSTDATYGTASLGARLMGTVGESFLGRSAIGELRLQVAQDFGDETNVARVGLGGIQRDVIGSKVGKTSVQIGAGITIPVTEQGALYLDVNTDFRSKATDVNGSVGYRVNF